MAESVGVSVKLAQQRPGGDAHGRSDSACAGKKTSRVRSPRWDALRLASPPPELPRERTRLLDNLGRVRREVGPITPELSDAVADHMNIRRGEVHEVVSFYSFLQVPDGAHRVCTGPVCDCSRARSCSRLAGARGARASAHCDLAPRRRWTATPSSRRRHASTRTAPLEPDATLADYEARGGWRCEPRPVLDELEASGLAGIGGAGFPTGRKWASVLDEPGPRFVVRQRRRGRARDDQGPLRDGAPPASHARGDSRSRCASARPTRGTSTCARSTRRRAPGSSTRSPSCGAPAGSTGSRSSSWSARAPTSAARRRRCSSRWRAGGGCRG